MSKYSIDKPHKNTKLLSAFHIQSSSIILPSDFIEFFTLVMVAATLSVYE
jgi:hypothetical protein